MGWSELLPQWPTLSVNYTQGSGNGTIYGTNQETGSNTQTINAHSTYMLGGFRLIGYYDHTKFDTRLSGISDRGTGNGLFEFARQ